MSSLAVARVLIFKCFSALVVALFEKILPINDTTPVTTPLIPKAKAKGAPTPVDNKTAPAPSAPIVMVINALSIVLTTFAILKYFLLNASLFLISSSKNSCTSLIIFNLYECPRSSEPPLTTLGAVGCSLSVGYVG